MLYVGHSSRRFTTRWPHSLWARKNFTSNQNWVTISCQAKEKKKKVPNSSLLLQTNQIRPSWIAVHVFFGVFRASYGRVAIFLERMQKMKDCLYKKTLAVRAVPLCAWQRISARLPVWQLLFKSRANPAGDTAAMAAMCGLSDTFYRSDIRVCAEQDACSL